MALGSISLNMFWNPSIKGSSFLQASMKGIHTYATKLDKVNILGATRFPLLNRHIKQLDNHLGKIRSKTAKISANPIKLDIKTSRDSLKEARKDMTAIEHDAKQVAFYTKKASENLRAGANAQSGTMHKKAKSSQVSGSTVVGAVAIASTMLLPIKASIDYETTIADVTKTVNFAGKKDIAQFSNELLNLSHTIPMTVNQLGEISASGGQLGITKDKILDFTTVVAKMSTAFDMSASDAGTSMASLMNIYGGGIKEVKKLGDAINYLSNNSAAKAGDIVNVLGRIGGNAKALNMTSIEASNLASAFLALGKPPEIVGTALNSMLGKFGNIDGQSKKFKSSLSEMGIDAVSFQEKMRTHPQEAMLQFLKTLNSMDKASQSRISYAMFGQEFGDDMLLLSSGVKHYQHAVKLTANATNYLGSMQKEFEIKASTTKNSLQLLGNKMTHLSISLGSAMLPFIKKASSYIGKLTLGLVSLTKTFPEASKWIFGLGAAFVVGSVALAGFGLVASGVGAGLALLASPVTAIVLGIMAIGAGAVYLYNKFDFVKSAIDNLFSGFVSGISPVLSELKSAFGGLFGAIGGLFNSLKPVFSFIGSALSMIGINFTNTGSIIGSAFGVITFPIRMVVKALTWVINIGAMVVDGWVKIGQVAGAVWSGVTNAIKSPFVSFFDWISAKFKAIFGLVDKAKSFITGPIDAVKDKASSMWSGTKSFFGFGDDKKEPIKSKIPKAGVPVNNVDFKGSSLKETQIPTVPIESVSDVTTGAITQTKEFMQNNTNTTQGVNQNITNHITVHANSGGQVDYEDLKQKISRANKELAMEDQEMQLQDVS